MGRRSPETMAKRQRELAKAQKRLEKQARRQQRKAAREQDLSKPVRDSGVDSENTKPEETDTF